MKFINWVKKQKEKVVAALAGASVMAATTVTTFAAEGDYVAVTAADLAPVLEGAKANAEVVAPIAIGLIAILIGVGIIPIVIRKFKSGV